MKTNAILMLLTSLTSWQQTDASSCDDGYAFSRDGIAFVDEYVGSITSAWRPCYVFYFAVGDTFGCILLYWWSFRSGIIHRCIILCINTGTRTRTQGMMGATWTSRHQSSTTASWTTSLSQDRRTTTVCVPSQLKGEMHCHASSLSHSIISLSSIIPQSSSSFSSLAYSQ